MRRVRKVGGRRALAAGGALYRRESAVRHAGRHVGRWLVVAVVGGLLVTASLALGLTAVLVSHSGR